jgi:hypothetical protein
MYYRILGRHRRVDHQPVHPLRHQKLLEFQCSLSVSCTRLVICRRLIRCSAIKYVWRSLMCSFTDSEIDSSSFFQFIPRFTCATTSSLGFSMEHHGQYGASWDEIQAEARIMAGL